MSRSPDSRISTERRAFPCTSARIAAQWPVPVAPYRRPTPRLQWRDRVGFAPTSLARRDVELPFRVYLSRPVPAVARGGPGLIGALAVD